MAKVTQVKHTISREGKATIIWEQRLETSASVRHDHIWLIPGEICLCEDHFPCQHGEYFSHLSSFSPRSAAWPQAGCSLFFPNESFSTFQTNANPRFPSFFWTQRISLFVSSLINSRRTTAIHFFLICSPLEDWHVLGRCQWKGRGLLLVGWKEVLLLRGGCWALSHLV